MSRMIPPVPSDYPYEGEKQIARRLQDDPSTKEWVVLHSLDISEHKSQVVGECDFVIIIPNKGVLCVEVKACKSMIVKDGVWYYGKKSKGDKRGPFKQASENMHSIQNYLLNKRPELSKVVFWSTVIFPYISFSGSSSEWHDWQVIDARQYISRPISQLFLHVINQARLLLENSQSVKWFKKEATIPDFEQRDLIVEILRPEFEFFESPASRQNELDTNLKKYTKEQFIALDAMQTNPRVVFDGPAGTGKTLVAIEAARRSVQQGKKTIFLCFNKFIAQWVDTQFTKSEKQNLNISTLHALMLNTWNGKPPHKSDSYFWTNTLPEKAIETLLTGSEVKIGQFDAMIIDEAQDILRNNYLDFIDLCLEGGLASGTWNMFGDFVYQQIYSAATIHLDEFISNRSINTPVYSLRVNCRNTPRIAAYAPLLGGLKPDYFKILRPDDNIKPKLIFYKNEQEQKNKLSDLLLFYRDKEKFKGTDIVILSPLNKGACAANMSSPWKDRLKVFTLDPTGGHIRYSSIHSFKGLEAPVIIVTDLTQISDKESMNLLYIAITRSLSRLVLLINESAQKDMKKILGV